MQILPLDLIRIIALIPELVEAYWKFQEAKDQDEEAVQQEKIRNCVASICDVKRIDRPVLRSEERSPIAGEDHEEG